MRPPSVLLVHAHPDDESLWTGGTIARIIEQGSATSVVTCTWIPGTHRHAELVNALAVLGAEAPTTLGYADGGFPESAPDSVGLCECRFDDAVAQLTGHIRAIRPDIVITYDAYGIYGHPDHIAAHRLTIAAVEAAACAPLYPDAGPAWQTGSLYLSTVPARVMHRIRHQVNTGPSSQRTVDAGSSDAAIDLELDVSAWVETKWTAICAHGSEMHRSPALVELAGLDDRRRNALLGTEWYLRRDLVSGGVDLV